MKKLSKVVNTWLHKNGFGYISVREGKEWVCNNKMIGYTLVVEDEEQDKRFMEVCREVGLEYEVNDFIVSLFHEIGHFNTRDDFSVEQWNEERKLDFDDMLDMEMVDYIYFHRESELVATEWGVDYINSHIEKVRELEKLVDNFVN